jgi:hypothetical protein
MSRRRAIVLGLALLATLAAVDFVKRIYVPREARVRDAESLVPAKVPAAAAVADIRRDLASWLPGLQPIVAGADPSVDSSWSLALLGVFQDRGGGFAVIRATPAAGGEPSVQAVKEGDEVFGLRVAGIDPRRVVLLAGEQRQELELFKARQPQVKGAGPAPASSTKQPAAPSAMAAGAATSVAGRAAASPPAVPGQATVEAQELQQGMTLKLPSSLLVVEGKLPATEAGKKRPRLPGQPREPKNP